MGRFREWRPLRTRLGGYGSPYPGGKVTSYGGAVRLLSMGDFGLRRHRMVLQLGNMLWDFL
jgi:hypothetical protein